MVEKTLISQSACQSGYFEPSFKRVLAGEALSDPIKEAYKTRQKKIHKRIGRGVWIPSSGEKSIDSFYVFF